MHRPRRACVAAVLILSCMPWQGAREGDELLLQQPFDGGHSIGAAGRLCIRHPFAKGLHLPSRRLLPRGLAVDAGHAYHHLSERVRLDRGAGHRRRQGLDVGRRFHSDLPVLPPAAHHDRHVDPAVDAVHVRAHQHPRAQPRAARPRGLGRPRRAPHGRAESARDEPVRLRRAHLLHLDHALLADGVRVLRVDSRVHLRLDRL